MLRSMTGYGKATFIDEGMVYLLEVHTVNRKSLDISVYMPRELLSLEIDLRKWIGTKIQRGQITVKLSKEAQDHKSFIPNPALLRSFKETWEQMAIDLGYPKDVITLKFIMQQLELLPKGQKIDLEPFKTSLQKAAVEALSGCVAMKCEEGEKLTREIKSYLAQMSLALEEITQHTGPHTQEYKKKLETKLQEFDLVNPDTQEKIARELVIYLDKIDITEEIERLKAHITHFLEKIAIRSEEAMGKILEFLVIEMNREANTIAAKSTSLEIINKGLAIKSLIEKIREQIQNIE